MDQIVHDGVQDIVFGLHTGEFDTLSFHIIKKKTHIVTFQTSVVSEFITAAGLSADIKMDFLN